MGIFLFANSAETTLAAPVGPTDGTISVASTTGALFPSPTGGDMFAVTLQSVSNPALEEICYCTSRTGDVLTVTRGEEGTTPSSFLVADAAANLWTAGQAASYIQTGTGASLANVQQQAGNWAADSGSANAMIVALNPAPVSRASMDGAPMRILKSAAPNTAAVTLNFGFGAEPVTLPDGTAMVNGQLPASGFLEVIWNEVATRSELVSVNASISNHQLAQAAAGTLKGNLTGSTAGVLDNTLAAVAAALAPDLGTSAVARVYATLSGTTWTIKGTSGTITVLSITHLVTGHHQVTLSAAMSNDFYCFEGNAGNSAAHLISVVCDETSRTTTTVDFWTNDGAGLLDPTAVSLTITDNP